MPEHIDGEVHAHHLALGCAIGSALRAEPLAISFIVLISIRR